eukprot:Opistho-1_new@70575
MNDIRRSILWVVFGLSMVLIWDKWQIHNGQKPTFFPGTAPAVTAPAASTSTPAAADASLPVAAGQAPVVNAAGQAPAGAPGAVAQRHEVRTDLFKLVFNSEGGSLIGAQLLKHAEAPCTLR